MAKGILGKKIGMLQIWDEKGKRQCVTVIEAGPCPIVQRKTKEKDGYNSIQIAYLETKEKKLSKAERAHLKKHLSEKWKDKCFSKLLEIKDADETILTKEEINCDVFEVGEKIFVQGISKGKGFQGVVKRYNFRGGRKTHGSHFHRAPGAVGAGTYPGRVIKGQKMPGRMGAKKVTIKNLEVLKVLQEDNTILVKGSVPGPKGNLVYLYKK